MGNISTPTLIDYPIYEDSRGSFQELFRSESSKPELSKFSVGQINTSLSFKGVLRGLHFSTASEGQSKLLHVVSGSIVDVVVNLRNPESDPQAISFHMSSLDQTALWIPHGYAHGFLALEDNTRVIYAQSSPYRPDSEHVLNAFDPGLAIPWKSWCDQNGIASLVQSQRDSDEAMTKAEALSKFLEVGSPEMGGALAG